MISNRNEKIKENKTSTKLFINTNRRTPNIYGDRYTHHADHISGGASLKDILQCTYAMHKNAPVNCAAFRLSDGFGWKLLEQIPIKVLYTRGHKTDPISPIFPDRIFTGDALSPDDGATDGMIFLEEILVHMGKHSENFGICPKI